LEGDSRFEEGIGKIKKKTRGKREDTEDEKTRKDTNKSVTKAV
jgi:hypothetical protein